MIPPDTDIVILQRPREPLCNKGILTAHRDKVLIVELDDHPDYIGIDHDWLRGCHAIQCSTEPLAEICRQYNPNVMVFENQIAELPPWHEPIADNHITIFFGAQNREMDWLPIMPALNRVTKDNWPRVHVQVIHDRVFFDALDTPLKIFREFCPYEEYRSLLRGCHIALLPLEDTAFNRCKSDIKFLECAAEGVVPLMSLTACRAINDGSCTLGMFWNSVNPFEFSLRQLVDNEHNGRQLLAEKHYRYVRDHRLLSQHFRKRYDWYQSLLAAKPTLDRQLLERVPELSERLAIT